MVDLIFLHRKTLVTAMAFPEPATVHCYCTERANVVFMLQSMRRVLSYLQTVCIFDLYRIICKQASFSDWSCSFTPLPSE